MKKQGISGQSVDPDKAKAIADRPRVEKDFRSKQLIREAIMENDFLKHLAPSQVREIVDYMEKKKVKTSFKKTFSLTLRQPALQKGHRPTIQIGQQDYSCK